MPTMKTKRQRRDPVQMAQIVSKPSPAEEALAAQLHAAGQSAAAERFRVAGLPTRRIESYHYTDLKALVRDVPELVGHAAQVGAPEIRVPGAYRLVIVNGAVQNAGTAPAGVIVGQAKGSALSETDDALVRLNSALVRESLTLDLAGSVDPVIHIDRRIEGEAAHGLDSARIFIADGAKATIVETYSGSDAAHLGNHATFLTVGKSAEVRHIVVDLNAQTARHFNTVEYELGAEANLHSLAINSGAGLARTQVFARFAGEGAHADFAGLSLIENTQHVDTTLEISHAVPNTTSSEVYKTVARDRGKGVFQGKIVVAKDAQKTDAKMMSQGLMLSEDAEIFAKPELEIFADDVVCGHGATCGELDETALFYLMSRGIPRVQAQAVLVRAFISEVLDPIKDEELHEALENVAEAWLVRGFGGEANGL